MYTELTSKEQVNNVLAANEAIILYFYNDHCAPCISLRPKVKEMVDDQFPKLKLFFVNSEKYPDIPAGYQVFANPTLLLYFDGREYRRESKYISIPQLAEEIARPYQMIFD
jgi:thiol-disulfide isomerase/thioredoxin